MNIREGTCGVRCGVSSPTTIQVPETIPIRIFRCFSESNHWQELSQNKNEAPSPITTTTSTWDRYLLQKCGASHVEPQTSSAGATKTRPNPGTSCSWTKISCLCRSSNQLTQQQQQRWLHQLKVIGVFRNDTTNKRNNRQHNHATTSASNKTEKFFTTT